MELSKALGQISEIRNRIAENQTFRGYRSATVAWSACLAGIGATVQELWISQPMQDLNWYLGLWIAIASAWVTVSVGEMVWRIRRGVNRWHSRLTWTALSYLAPSIVAGIVLTFVIANQARDAAWMLPGLWSILLSLGVFSSARMLPRATMLVGFHYLVAGTVCLLVFDADRPLSPWAMLLTFGLGQAASAVVLYLTLERNHGQIAEEDIQG